MAFQNHGVTSLQELFGDLVVYRNLIPADRRLPSFSDLREQLGLGSPVPPRKAEAAYGRVVAEMLRRGRAHTAPGTVIKRLLYIGDTRLNDGRAFEHICAAGRWPGWVFIGRDDRQQPPQANIAGSVYLANRWSLLPDFLRFVEKQGLALDEETAVVVDVDKTAIGARGRNDGVIDHARLEGVRRTVADLLGPAFDQEAFQAAYDELNRPAYHAFTSDNQDYLAYTCLILGAGLWTLTVLIDQVRAGAIRHFGDLIAQVERRRHELAATGLGAIHDDVWRCVQAGDPTPFKAFRRNEYLATVARFGDLPGAGVEEVLQQRIVITQEVREAAVWLRRRGTLILAISDKPDEASLPDKEQARAGMRPLHHLEALAVGER